MSFRTKPTQMLRKHANVTQRGARTQSGLNPGPPRCNSLCHRVVVTFPIIKRFGNGRHDACTRGILFFFIMTGFRCRLLAVLTFLECVVGIRCEISSNVCVCVCVVKVYQCNKFLTFSLMRLSFLTVCLKTRTLRHYRPSFILFTGGK